MTSNDMNTFAHTSSSSDESVSNFDIVAGKLEAILTAHDQDAMRAMDSFDAQNVSQDFLNAQKEWFRAGGEVRSVIAVVRQAIGETSTRAGEAQQRAAGQVSAV